MSPRWIALITLVAAGCTASMPAAERPAHGTSVAVERGGLNPILALPRRVPPRPDPPPARTPVAQPEPVVEDGGPLTGHPVPDGVKCTVVGTGAPFPESCEPPLVAAFPSRTGGTSKVRFGIQNIDVTWGFFDRDGRAFVAVDSGGLRLRAYAHPAPVRFQLVREVEVVPGHVWLGAEAPVIVTRATREGALRVRVDDDVPGVADVASIVACGDLRFELVPSTPFAVASAASALPPLRQVTPKRNILRLLTAPGGQTITTLRGNDDHPLPFLSVLDEQRGHTRVAFDTNHARFDAWVANSGLEDEGGLVGVRGASACGRSIDYIGTRTPHLRRDTPLRVGSGPDAEPIEGLVAVEGTAAFAGEERDGFVSVSFISEIVPAQGTSFWVPLDALDR